MTCPVFMLSTARDLHFELHYERKTELKGLSLVGIVIFNGSRWLTSLKGIVFTKTIQTSKDSTLDILIEAVCTTVYVPELMLLCVHCYLRH